MRQNTFAKNYATLILQLVKEGYLVVLGEVERPQEMQDLYLKQGKTKVRHSKHQDRIAADIFLYKEENGKYVQLGEEAYARMGALWKELDPQNVWGGDWKSFHDANHIQYGV